MLLTISLDGIRWLVSADSPIAAKTADIASSTGMPAAISAPNASSRIASVIGTLNSSAFLKSPPRTSSRAFDRDAPPTCSIRRSPCAACSAAVVSSSGCTWSLACSESAFMVTGTRTALRFGAGTGVPTLATSASPRIRCATSFATVLARAGSNVPDLAVIRTFSTVGASKCPASTICCACSTSPFMLSSSVLSRVPAAPPAPDFPGGYPHPGYAGCRDGDPVGRVRTVGQARRDDAHLIRDVTEDTVAQAGTVDGATVRRGPFGADPIPLNPVRALASPYTWLATVHLFSDLWVGLATFTSMVVLLAMSVALMPVALLGLPVLVASVYVARGWAAVERTRFRLTLGIEIVPPQRPAKTTSVPRFLWRLLANVAAWRQIGYHLLLLPVGVFTFVATAFAWSGPVALALLPTYNHALPNGGAHLLFWRIHGSFTEFVVSMTGLVLLLFVPYVIRGLSTMDAALARALLGQFSTRELSERVGALEQSRRRVVDAAEAEQRRIERDLHDGAQQRLVSLAMTLGRAKSRYATDPTSLGPLIDEAHREAKQAIVELRNLTRGIHPPVLTDRGLDAALSALAARCPVPVTVEVEVAERPSQTIEAIAYFVVAEALTNVARHAGANTASVLVRRSEGTLRIVVLDDGRGGADIDKGTGLLGLADRVSGVDGRLDVDSPPGGPTVLTVELPCA